MWNNKKIIIVIVCSILVLLLCVCVCVFVSHRCMGIYYATSYILGHVKSIQTHVHKCARVTTTHSEPAPHTSQYLLLVKNEFYREKKKKNRTQRFRERDKSGLLATSTLNFFFYVFSLFNWLFLSFRVHKIETQLLSVMYYNI